MADQFDNNKDNDQEQKYEKFCFLCRRPESQAGKMIDLPNHIHICADCMQKSFDTMNTQMNNGNYSDLFNMPNVSMIDLSSFQNPGNQAKKIKKKSETPKPVIDLKDIPAPHKIKATLDEYVIGQDEAVHAVAKAIRRGRVGLKDPNRPIGSFLFLGPTGVGKTELSKALAQAVFGKEEDIIRVDMSEYMEKHSVSKMIGSPPGYVGYEDGGQLSEKVRRHPYSVILFDEIEKAHSDVFNILLQILEDGHITDAQGRRVSFKNTVIIMTSNAGAQRIIAPKHLGFGTKEDAEADYKQMKESVLEEVKKLFKPEFINRIDELLVFHVLTQQDIEKIAGVFIDKLAKRLQAQMSITFTVTQKALAHIAKSGFDKNYGARPVRRAIQTQIEDALADKMLAKEIQPGDCIEADADEEKIIFCKR